MTTEQYNESVDLFADRLYRFVIKSLNHAADAEDVVQTCFEILWRNHSRVAFESCRSYLFTVAYHEILRLLRRQPVEELTDTLPVGYLDDNLSLRELLERCLQRLPPQQKAVVLLRDYEGYRYEEIAEITGLSLAQVKVYIFRARRKLRDDLLSLRHVV